MENSPYFHGWNLERRILVIDLFYFLDGIDRGVDCPHARCYANSSIVKSCHVYSMCSSMYEDTRIHNPFGDFFSPHGFCVWGRPHCFPCEFVTIRNVSKMLVQILLNQER